MKKSKTIFLIFLGVLLFAIIAGTIAYRNSVSTEAATLPGIEKITVLNDSANPFVIVEVVPDKSDARFGYLVGGEEPIYNGKSLRDMPSAEERIEAMAAFDSNHSNADDLLTAGAITYESPYAEVSTGTTHYEIRGSMVATAGGNYAYENVEAVYALIDPSVSDNDIQHYEKYVDFTNSDGGYGVSFYNTTHLTVDDLKVDGIKVYHKYEIYETAIDTHTSDNDWLAAHNGENVYIRGIDAYTDPKYEYYGSLHIDLTTSPETLDVILGDGTTVSATSLVSANVLLSINVNDSAGSYYIHDYTSGLANGPFDMTYVYAADDGGNYYRVSEAGQNLLYKNDYSGTHSFQSNYSSAIVDTVRYEKGITNAEWFKRYVMDIAEEYTDTFICDVKVMTMSEFNASTLTDVSMVVLRGGTYSDDILADTAQKLYAAVVDNKLPIVIEADFGSDATNVNSRKLSALLRQNSSKGISSSDAISGWDNDGFWNNGSTGVYKTVKTSTSMFVNGSILVCPGSSFVGDDFLTEVDSADYSSESSGLYRVYAEITSENAFLSRTGTSERISNKITKAAVLRYILNYASQRVIIKSEISVLEIEPCYSFSPTFDENMLREVFIPWKYSKNNDGIYRVSSLTRNILSTNKIASDWATQFQGYTNNIHLTQTYTKEFVGKVEDLNESYDLIYIGLDTSSMNTDISLSDGYFSRSNVTVYNDHNMDGLVYTHMGDTATSVSSSSGSLAATSLVGSNDTKNRYSGNDITKQKLKELKEYINAGYPIIFADGFFNVSGSTPTGVNNSRIDISSNMNLLGQYVLKDSGVGFKYPNVFIDSQVTNSDEVKKTLSGYLNTSKLMIETVVTPVAFDSAAATPQYLPKTNGNYYLNFEFALKNDAAVSVANTTYNVQLYIDTSVDGRYSKEEEISSLNLYEYGNGSWYYVSHDAEGKYNLVAGKSYKIERQVPTGYTGILPWKLKFTQNGNINIRKSISGYTAVAAETKPEIKVLQIVGNNSGNTLDLVNGKVKNDAGNNVNVRDEIAKITDFTVNVEQINASTFIASYGRDRSNAYSYLEQYDMLIIGFYDMYQFTTSERRLTSTEKTEYAGNAALAIKDYINTGRSVLFTHDTTSFYNDDSSKWGYAFNKYIRSAVGMDRYNVMNDPSVTEYDKVAAVAGRSGTYIQGYNDATINRYSAINEYKSTDRPVMGNSSENTRGGIYSSSNKMYVTKVNDGQITNYPFSIPTTFAVAYTHAQYYQLNLDTLVDDDNTKDDIVVWYCISDVDGNEKEDIYQAAPNDVRNNYYIYNKGNVTYSGVGHSTVNTLNELHLFINTMVAAYAAGVHPPKVSYFNDSAATEAVANAYMLYDKATSTYISDKVDMFFEIADNNFVQCEREELLVHYYLPDSSGAIIPGGPAIKLKEFTPVVKRGGVALTDISKILKDVRYQLTVTKDQLNNADTDVAKIYISTEMIYYAEDGTSTSSGVGFFDLSVVRSELLDLE